MHPVILIDVANVKSRDGRATNRPIYLATAVTVNGHRDILGIWAGDGGGGTKHWLHVCTELKNRSMAKALKPVYTAPTEDFATERFMEFAETWGKKYPVIVKLWPEARSEFVPFLAFDVEIRKVIYFTNAIESVNARIRKAVRARGHFPNEQTALKCMYMALMILDQTGAGHSRWTMRWKAPLNAFQIAFEGRLTPANH